MTQLPDLEGLAIFAKVAELRSFAATAAELQLSKATVSKAVGRLEDRLGTRLFNRTSRRLALTNAGQQLVGRAAQILADGEAAENEALAQSATPRGTVRLAVPMSFGLLSVAPLLPDFLAAYPEITIELHLSDQMIDIVGEGFDAALRIAALPDSSLIAQKLCNVTLQVVAAPSYLKARGRPTHPLHLAEHNCFTYFPAGDTWRFTSSEGETAAVKPRGDFSANNGDVFLPALIAGVGIARLPDFIVREALAQKKLEAILPEWSSPPAALHWVTPPGGHKPARVAALARFLAERLAMR